MLRMIRRIDAIEKVTKVAPNIACLSQPHDTAPRDNSVFRFDEIDIVIQGSWINNYRLRRQHRIHKPPNFDTTITATT